ncbi:hypothetical protein RHMOL_Rhmol02G0045100 [Rhododendron molle]|uniref:Uncharacterized protein n=1 Tax=Rhododendron molle TaxID=49168 RepID=A0ACC0PP41_RHOML|nr:hypothetical protein RHMOL_Rhmol02G0045100 [Rhododendron molle]
MCVRALLHNGLSDTSIDEYTPPPPSGVTIDTTPTPSIQTSDFAEDVEDGQPKRSGKKFPNAISIHTSHAFAATCVITICKVKRDIGQQWKKLSNEDRQKYKHLAKLAKEDLAKEKGLLPEKFKKRKLQNRISLKSIVGIVQKLSKDQRLAVELIGLGGLLHLRCTVLNHPLCNWLVKNFDPKSRSLNVHGRTFVLTVGHVHECLGINAEGKVIDLEVNMSDEFSQLCENIEMTKGVVQLKELREYLEGTEEVGDVFKRKFALYMLGCFLCPTTKAGVTRSFMNGVSDVVAMGSQNWANLTLDFLCKGIQEQRDKHLVQPNGCLFLLVVFYFDRVSRSPTVTSYVRKFPSLVNWGDIEIKYILHEFDNIGGYDSEGVVVNFTLDEGTKVDGNTSAKEADVSQISCGDVSVMTSTLITVASLLLCQNMILAKHFGSEMLADLHAQTAQEMDLTHGLEGASSHLVTQLTGLHTCRTSSLNEFETHAHMLKRAKGVETNPTQPSHLASEMLSKPQQQEQPPPQIAQQMDLNQSVILQIASSPLSTGVHTCETSTPKELKTPDYVLNKSKAVYDMPTSCFDQYNMVTEMDMDEDEDVVSPLLGSGLKSVGGSSRGTDTGKRKIQHDIDNVVSSPSPVSVFKSQAGLSRGRKKKLAFGKPVISFCDEPARLREHAELKKSQFQRSPFTKDGLNKRNPPKNKNQAKTESKNIADQHKIVENIDINVPTVFSRSLWKIQVFEVCWCYAGVESIKQGFNSFPILLVQCSMKDAYVHLKMFGIERFFATRYDLCSLKPKAWILDTKQILSNPNLNDSDLMKLCDSYFGHANFTADLSSCSMMEVLHRALRLHYGDLYKADVSKFNIANVERQPLQHDTDGYDCRLFIIKFMQWFNYPSGVHRMDDTERPRLLMDLLVNPNNREGDTVVRKFDEWKAKKVRSLVLPKGLPSSLIWGGQKQRLRGGFLKVGVSGNRHTPTPLKGTDCRYWIHEYKDKPYEELKQGKYVVKNRDGSLRCPFCPGKKKQQWQYRDLLQHASGVGSGAAWRKPKHKAQHLALTVYLTSDLAHEAEGGQMSSSSTNYRGDDQEKPQGPLYDPTTPNCFCGMWATLRIARPNSKHKGSLYYSCLKTGMERCKYFKWCLPISGQSHALGFADRYDDGFHGDAEVSTNNGPHVVALKTKVDLLEQRIRFMKNIINGLLWCVFGAIVIIFFKG